MGEKIGMWSPIIAANFAEINGNCSRSDSIGREKYLFLPAKTSWNEPNVRWQKDGDLTGQICANQEED